MGDTIAGLKEKIFEICPELEQHELIDRPTFHSLLPGGRMKTTGFALLLALLLPCAEGLAIVNPHIGDGRCNSCHTKVPATGPDGTIDYNFLAEDIDPTCMICHDRECCTIAKPHQSTHPSGIDRWDKKKYGTPEKLPLSNGYITCATCHFWRRAINPSAQDYKLVRMVEISASGIDWTKLCSDCHKGH